ncbi:hypothetical protein [Leptospira perolatii]|uniref:hypothetical protein n=1 Tax=Leptospira perolatii TaxID=2023191 RepID=UPI001FAE92F1|nr:hypothetical protein [Leptospira perolatii]
MDDSSLLQDGLVRLDSVGRAANTEKKPRRFSADSGFYTSLYSWGRVFSQKGGTKEEDARKTLGKASISPEFGWLRRDENSLFQILASPVFSYLEKVQLEREVVKLSDGELLISIIFQKGDFKTRMEAGRGFQRLDAGGFLFAGILNYGELGWEISSLQLKGSLFAGEFQSSPAYLPRDKTESPLGIRGGDLSWNPKSFLEKIRFFYYQYGEPRQEAVKGDFFRESEPFRPYGFFRYTGSEWFVSPLQKFRLEGSAFHVEGRRENGKDRFDSYKTRQSTNAWFATLSASVERNSYVFFLRMLYTSKDATFRTDQDSNGYSGIRTDPRGFLAPVSILLLRDFHSKEESPFSGVETVRKPIYESSSLQYYQIGGRKDWGNGWSSTLAAGFSISSIGRGAEILSLSGWKGEAGFLLGGLAYAWVQPGEDQKFLIDEVHKKAPIREYFRWYLSAGLTF